MALVVPFYFQECPGHAGVKEPRVLWLGDEEYIVSTGFNQVTLFFSFFLKGLHFLVSRQV